MEAAWTSKMSVFCYILQGITTRKTSTWNINRRESLKTRIKLFFYSEELFVTRPTPKLQDHPLSAVRDCLFSISAATLPLPALKIFLRWGTVSLVQHPKLEDHPLSAASDCLFSISTATFHLVVVSTYTLPALNVFLRWGAVCHSSTPKTRGPPLVGCPRLFIQYLRSYSPSSGCLH